MLQGSADPTRQAICCDDVSAVLQQVLHRFDRRHKQFEGLLERHFALVARKRGVVLPLAQVREVLSPS